MAIVQEISDDDMANRGTLAERLIGNLSDDALILMTDEAHFHLCGWANKHDFPYCVEENARSSINGLFTGQCDSCAVENLGVTGPYFFEDVDGSAVAVTSAICVEMLRNFLSPELSRRGIELSAIWF
jgi:hypothetical protein